MQAAVDAYDAALDGLDARSRQPLQWAAVQNNIGATYVDLGRLQKGSAGTDALQQGGRCLQALPRPSARKDNDPRDWALTQYNLGPRADRARRRAARTPTPGSRRVDCVQRVARGLHPGRFAGRLGRCAGGARLGARQSRRAEQGRAIMIQQGRDAMQNAVRLLPGPERRGRLLRRQAQGHRQAAEGREVIRTLSAHRCC